MGDGQPQRPESADPGAQHGPSMVRSTHAQQRQSLAKRTVAWLTTVQGVVTALASVVVALGALVFSVKQFGNHDSGPSGVPAAVARASISTSPGLTSTSLAPAATDSVTSDASPQGPTDASASTPADPTSTVLVPLYTLPANSAGQMGPQQGPINVTLAGRVSPKSTAVTCAGSVTFHLDGKYRHLVGWAGVADFAPSTIDNLIYVIGDGKQIQVFAVTPDKVLPVDLEVTGVKTLELQGSDRGISKCTDGSRTYDYLGDAYVF